MTIRTQVFVVEVSASVMPSLTAAEVEDAVRRLAYAKERPHGMGSLDVCAYEGFNERSSPVTVTDWQEAEA